MGFHYCATLAAGLLLYKATGVLQIRHLWGGVLAHNEPH